MSNYMIIATVGAGKRSYVDRGLKKNKTYYYMIGSCSKKYKKSHQPEKLSDEKSIRTGAVTVKTGSVKKTSFTVKWNRPRGIKKFKVYKKSLGGKKYSVKTVSGGKTSVKLSKLQSGTAYSIYVTAYYRGGRKVKSQIVQISTKGSKVTSGNKKYIKKNLNENCGIVVSDRKRSSAAMNRYGVEKEGTGIRYASLKYNVTPKKVYIHIYLNIYYAKGAQKRFQAYTWKNGKAVKKGGVGHTYKNLILQGIHDTYAINSINARDYDFGKKTGFKSQIVIHQKGSGEKYDKSQDFIKVKIGGNCSYCGSNWYHVDSYNNTMWFTYDDKNPVLMHMATNGQLKNNLKPGRTKQPYDKESEYKATAAHEIGHCLGLGDAYTSDYYNGRKIVRVVRISGGSEAAKRISSAVPGEEWQNLMTNYSKSKKINQNDLEMMLDAYVTAVKRYKGLTYARAMQFYKTHAWYGSVNKKSDQIRNGTSRPWKFLLGTRATGKKSASFNSDKGTVKLTAGKYAKPKSLSVKGCNMSGLTVYLDKHISIVGDVAAYFHKYRAADGFISYDRSKKQLYTEDIPFKLNGTMKSKLKKLLSGREKTSIWINSDRLTFTERIDKYSETEVNYYYDKNPKAKSYDEYSLAPHWTIKTKDEI